MPEKKISPKKPAAKSRKTTKAAATRVTKRKGMRRGFKKGA
jgi:hypothetical protein